MRRGRVYYGKLARGKAMFLASRMIPYFKALWGVPRREEKKRLTEPALRVLRVLRKEWEMGTADLRLESGVSDRKCFTQALDELQTAMIVVPNEAVYLTKIQLPMGPCRGAFPERVGDKSRSSYRSTRNRSLLSFGGGHDGSGRTGTCHCVVASRSRTREPSVSRGRLCRPCGSGYVSVGLVRCEWFEKARASFP